jgi:hypothetical protein
MREDGCEIDRVFVAKDASVVPSDVAELPGAIKKGVMETWRNTREQRMDTAFDFVARDGVVVMEAEFFPVTEGWLYQASGNGFSGFGYLEWGMAGQGIKPGRGVLQYNFEIAAPGTYQLLIRGRMKEPANRPETIDRIALVRLEREAVKDFDGSVRRRVDGEESRRNRRMGTTP